MTNLRLIGDREVWPLGLGGAQWSLTEHPDDDQAIQVIHAALDAGVTLIDTARAYTTMGEPSHNESLIQRALITHPRGADVMVSTKGGHYRAGQQQFPIDGSEQTLRAHVDASRRALQADTLDLFFLHHPDPLIPIEVSARALQRLKDSGAITRIGLSNVSREQFLRAQAVAEIDAELAQKHPGAAAVSDRRGISVSAVALGWLLSQSANIIPILGARRPSSIVDSALHAPTDLTLQELDSIAAAPE
ncbi:hypothetical protein C5B96_12915 [Subtercola sp. Z020]|uniref:aldo/keto reductase n=1 Tax=Subtercola sp. Z020 TaxID=2080582 RepID=UPI000D40234C|nr:aldo/keto reductase [Subtercola sp. Z020]PPF79298.1 hypothetical protein C5B96_12915 [Subtercola sp. Z020]